MEGFLCSDILRIQVVGFVVVEVLVVEVLVVLSLIFCPETELACEASFQESLSQ